MKRSPTIRSGATRPRASRPAALALAAALGLALTTPLAWAQAAPRATLGQLFDLAREADALYAAARATAEAGREKVAQGRAGLLPTITAGGSWKNHRDTPLGTGLTTPRSYDSNSLSLNINQPLFRRVNNETASQAELQADLAEAQLKLAEQELLLRVSKGYFDVLQAQDALGAIGAQKEAFALQLAQAKRSFEVGLAPITDVNEAQARHDLTAAQEIAARNDLESKRRTLEKSIDRDLPPLALIDEGAPIDIIPEGHLRALVERAPDDSLQVGAAKIAESIARKEIARQDAAQLPTIDLVASVVESRNSNTSTTGQRNNQRSVNGGIEVSVPIYNGGATVSRIREAQANLTRAEQELLNARRQARLDSRQAYLGVQSGSALHRALRQALSSAETQLRSTRRGFEVGVRTRVDVLNAEQQFHATRKDLSAARYQTLVAALQLKAAAGVLTEHDLKAMDRLLIKP